MPKAVPGIDLHLCICAREQSCGEDFGIAVGCPGSSEMEGHPWKI